MAAHRGNSDETAAHTYAGMFASLEMAVDTDLMAQNAFTFTYETAKT